MNAVADHPADAVLCGAVLHALADAIVSEHLPSGEVTIHVADGLPSTDFPRAQPALGDWWRVRVDEAQREAVQNGIWSVAVGEQESWMDEYTFHWTEQMLIHVVHRVVLLRDERGTPLRLVHVFQDATAKRQAQGQLLAERRDLELRVSERTHALTRKNVELARAMRHKDEFLASMSHELRTPLNAVLGLTDAMLEGIGGPITDRQRGWLTDVAASGKHLLGLINDFLDLARIESGRLEPDPQQTSPVEIVSSAMRLIAGAALARNVNLQSDLPPDLPAFVTDPRLLRQILTNLLGNAVKFTPPDGTVTVRVRADTAQMAFEVEDTGIGIPHDRHAEIFQPFLQIDAGLDRQAGGSGLGLAIVARMTDLLGGSVSVDSEPGRGSRFTVRLPSLGPAPRDSGETESATVDEVLISGSSPLRVLLAENNAANVRTFVDYFTGKGMEMEVAGDGESAVAAAAKQPDVILMDIQMPRLDGLQAIRLIRADARLRSIPIVAITALAMPGDRERCLDAGADAYMSKPVRLRELNNTINALLARREH